jgi:hypothetical protein
LYRASVSSKSFSKSANKDSGENIREVPLDLVGTLADLLATLFAYRVARSGGAKMVLPTRLVVGPVGAGTMRSSAASRCSFGSLAASSSVSIAPSSSFPLPARYTALWSTGR